MTEYNHIIVGFVLAQFFYYMFIRIYSVKFYKEIKNLKSGKNKVTLSTYSTTYDEFIKTRDTNN